MGVTERPLTARDRYDLAHTARVAARAHYEQVSEDYLRVQARHTEAGWALDEADRVEQGAWELLKAVDPKAEPIEGENQ